MKVKVLSKWKLQFEAIKNCSFKQMKDNVLSKLKIIFNKRKFQF